MSKEDKKSLEVGRAVMRAEAAAIEASAGRLGGKFEAAVGILQGAPSKVVVCGIGKSGHIGSKLAATLSSSGTPAVFLHAAEAIHGDLGLYQSGDPTILLSKSGSTEELLKLLPFFRKQASPIIAIVGNIESPIAAAADVVLDASVEREADPLNLMPTSSSTVSLALGDALASALVKARGFTAEEFAGFHPGGQLGRNLLLTVGDVMHPLERVARMPETATVREVVIEMSRCALGAACMIDSKNLLLGLLTDGDIRRLLTSEEIDLGAAVDAYMTREPLTIHKKMTLGEAVRLMETRSSQISVLPVVEAETGVLQGLFRLHDAYQPNFS
ncbi:MAG: KpsF/GutQ family sugar-phosphate isomerase [Verrucomicrobia bacterium]|nr:KpsF/GutQ family sugar-phosphate isomerase [Verrucomicrobiota bacterium]